MAQSPRNTLSIKKKSQYGAMFQAPKPIDGIEQNLLSEIVKILQENNGKNISDFNENFRVQKKIMTVMNDVYNQVQSSFAKTLSQTIFEDLIKKISVQLQNFAGLDSMHFDNALKGFKPCAIHTAEPPKVSYKV